MCRNNSDEPNVKHPAEYLFESYNKTGIWACDVVPDYDTFNNYFSDGTPVAVYEEIANEFTNK